VIGFGEKNMILRRGHWVLIFGFWTLGAEDVCGNASNEVVGWCLFIPKWSFFN